MSEEMKDSIVQAFVVTAIIILLFLIFGNTGSGFFRKTIIFIVSTIIGTPFAVIGKFLGSLVGSIIAHGEYRTLYKYLGFLLGVVLALGLTMNLFSSMGDKVEISFISDCVQRGNGSKAQCQCIYKKLDEKYDDLENILTKNPSDEFKEIFIKYTKECMIKNR